MIVLGIETSCDETAFAVVDEEKGLIAHQVFSQIAIHQLWGGVVPELASRDHCIRLLPLFDECLHEAGIKLADVDAVAYTIGPGLAGSLMMGATFAVTLGRLLDKPIYPIHHLEGHIVSAMIENQKAHYPALIVLVSGGHTMIIHAKAFGDYQVMGQSVDDALGEAFDKTAKLLGLPYPGGPQIERLAAQGTDGTFFNLPRPMLHSSNLDMSFSGLKTAVVQAWAQCGQTAEDKAGLAYCFQQAILEVLAKKVSMAVLDTGVKSCYVCGGVAANQAIRNRLIATMKKFNGEVFFPKLEFCTDNGMMIAYAGLKHLQMGLPELTGNEIKLYPRYPLEQYLTEWF